MVRLFFLASLAFAGAVHTVAEDPKPDLFTNVYVVPPTFMSMGKDRRPTATEILADGRISFPDGASAVYNPATSQLIVRNTEEQMELIEAYVDSIVTSVEKQMFISVREIEFEERPHLPSDSINPAKVDVIAADSKALTLRDRDDLVETLRRPPQSADLDSSVETSGILGVFTDPQFQVIFRDLANKLGSSGIISAPSVMARSGQPALIQVGEKRWGSVPTLGAEEDTVDLELFFPPHGEALRYDSPSLRATIWDGQTIAWTEEKKDGRFRIVFVTARIMDPAGLPVNPDAADLPAKAAIKRANLEREAKAQAEAKYTLTTEQQNRVKDADEAALRGSQLTADGDFKSAVYKYRQALELLPEHEMTDPRRTAYEKQMHRAMRLSMPADTKLHVVEKGDTVFNIATNYGVSIFELKEINNLDSDILRVGQLLVIPGETEAKPQETPKLPAADGRLEKALKEVIIPSFEIRDVSLAKAIGLLQIAFHSSLDTGLFPELEPRFVFENVDTADETKITLRLNNVPVSEALRYVCSLANCHYKIEGEQIFIRPNGNEKSSDSTGLDH